MAGGLAGGTAARRTRVVRRATGMTGRRHAGRVERSGGRGVRVCVLACSRAYKTKGRAQRGRRYGGRRRRPWRYNLEMESGSRERRERGERNTGGPARAEAAGSFEAGPAPRPRRRADGALGGGGGGSGRGRRWEQGRGGVWGGVGKGRDTASGGATEKGSKQSGMYVCMHGGEGRVSHNG